MAEEKDELKSWSSLMLNWAEKTDSSSMSHWSRGTSWNVEGNMPLSNWDSTVFTVFLSPEPETEADEVAKTLPLRSTNSRDELRDFVDATGPGPEWVTEVFGSFRKMLTRNYSWKETSVNLELSVSIFLWLAPLLSNCLLKVCIPFSNLLNDNS